MPPGPAPKSSCVLGFERRSHRRYQLNFGLQYRLPFSNEIRLGKIIDMGSSGICFFCPDVFPRGTKVELAIDWPISLDNVLLQLRITGRVLRQDKRGTAIETLRYEFHTRKSRAMPSEIRVA